MVRVTELNNIIKQTQEPNLTYLKDLIRNKRLCGVSEKGITTHVSHLHCFLNDIGNPDAATITQGQIEDWFLQKKSENTRSARPPSPSTLRGYLISISVLMQQLHGNTAGKEMVSRIRVKVPLTTVREEELLTDDELKRLMRAATSERDRAIVSLIYSSGARLGEVIRLNLGDVQLKKYGASIHIPGGKTGPRDIDMFVGVPEIRSWLNVHPLQGDKDAPLFVTKYPRGGQFMRLSEKAIQSVFNRLAKVAKIPAGKRTNPHAYRHKRATDVAEYLTTSDMKELFGWAGSSSMPNIYVHSSRKKVRAKLAERAGIKVPEMQAPSTMVKQCPKCGCINGANDLYCTCCQEILSDRLAVYDKKSKEYLNKNLPDLV